MSSSGVKTIPSGWELAAEAIAVKIRWFGLLVGYLFVNLGTIGNENRLILNAILALGILFAVLDTFYSIRGRVFLGQFPLIISGMEALFIGQLCFFSTGLESPFRYYYFLSLICCAIRYSSRITYATCVFHCISFSTLYLALPQVARDTAAVLLTLVVLGWVAWAGDAMATLLKRVGEHLSRLNTALKENQVLLETRIGERTRELQETQAHLLHQEKMAAFGLLAAGIAHEVGNPLASISSLVQMLQRRDHDAITREKLSLVNGQLKRIQTILRELINFRRPASTEKAWVSLKDILDEAWNIAKYYKRTKGRLITLDVPADIPLMFAVRDQLVQVFLNLVLNAIDATDKGGNIEVVAKRQGNFVLVNITDDGAGIDPENAARLFQPYFTTKKNGTGLGLFVTRQMVEGHEGSVEFTSAPGQGATFRVFLPLAGDRRPMIESRSEPVENCV